MRGKYDALTTAELYKKAKSGRDLLMKRKKRLQEAYDQSPLSVSPFGLRNLSGEGGREGIPQVSTSMGRVELKATLTKIDELRDMKTSTVKGAKAHQEQITRNLLQLPETGRLSKQQRARLSAFKADVASEYQNSGRDLVAEFWDAYSSFRKEYGSHIPYQDRVEEYKNAYHQLAQDNSGSYIPLSELKEALDEWGEKDYQKQQQETDNQITFGRGGGFGF